MYGEKRLPIGELLGIALGGIGLSYDDFCRLTPAEFGYVYREYRDAQDAAYRDGWERMLAAIAISPHVKNKITPQKLLPLQWDKPTATQRQDKRRKPLSAEESKARFERLARRG